MKNYHKYVGFNKRSSSGFTLIELLVVIAIIGILSSIVMASLNSARAKGGNASVKSNLSGIRSQSEIFYSDNNQDYTNLCSNQSVIDAINSALTAGGDTGTVATRCNSDSTSWAVNVMLKEPDGSNPWWCVDNSGAARSEPDELAGATICA